MAMSRIQQLITRFAPRDWAHSMETASRDWMVQCQSCGFERSVWELGGIRWKASGTKRTFGRCSNCGQLSWHKVYHRARTETTT
jgi:hypothetical protein